MNTDRFDEAIRKKLEGLDQKPTEQEIDQVVQHLTRKHVLKPRTGLRFSTLIIGAGSVALVAALLFFALRYFGNEETSVNAPVPEYRADSLIIDPTGAATPEPETPGPVAGQSISGDRVQQFTDTQTKENQINTEDRGNLPQPGERSVKEKSPQSLAPKKQNIPYLAENNPAVTQTTEGAEQMHEPEATDVGVSSGISGNQRVPATEDTSETLVEQEETALPAEVRTVISQEGTPVDTMAVEQPKTAVTESVPGQAGIPVPAPGRKLGNFRAEQWRAGVVSQLAPENLTFGAAGSFKLANGLGIDAGFRYMDFSLQKFDTRADFDRHDHHKKNNRFDDKLRFAEPDAPITIKSNLIQVPVAVTYSIRLPRRFSVELSLGTDLDLTLNQRLDFRGKPDSTGPVRDERFRTQGGSEFFNNLVFSAGLEKQWKSLVFQLSPFLRPQLKQVFYKPRETEFGIGLGIYYRFGL